VLVPLALIGKDTLRDFDISLLDGRVLPVLGRAENGSAALAALTSELVGPAGFQCHSIMSALAQIVFGNPADAIPLVEELLDFGTVSGVSISSPASISQFGARLARDLAENFLLIALVPDSDLEARQVIKYSFHWQVRLKSSNETRLNRFLMLGGWSSVPLELELSGPDSAASYHLEVHAPPGLLTAGLSLPAGSGSQPVGADETLDVVAHAHAGYVEPPAGPALLQLVVPITGIRALTTLVLFYTAAVMGLALGLPNAKNALLDASDGAAAILLAVPAVVVALLVRPGENAIAASVLLPFRMMVLACSTALVGVGASIVGVLHDPYLPTLWWSVGILAAVGFLYLAVGVCVGTE
jgi:hypothetical protein